MTDSSDGLRVEVLGPVEAVVAGRPVSLGGQRPRALFAALALASGRVVGADRLVDELWGEEPPVRARDSVQVHVSRLRRALTDAGARAGLLIGASGGYRLDVRSGERDIDDWWQALERCRRARASGDPVGARGAIEDGLRIWRGTPFAGIDLRGTLAAERARLEEERLGALIEAVELDLELDRHGEVLGQLEALVSAHPHMERLVELQMLALYRSGRGADALSAFHASRGRFVGELGIEPGQRLRDLYQGILAHDAALSGTDASPPPEERRRARPRIPRRLPVPPNRTIGRDAELDALTARLRTASARLITLTGPGGVGKTRLAIEAARAAEASFPDGACFVSLAPLRDPGEVAPAVVDALAIPVLSGESPEQAAERFVASRQVLLVVDNCEHVLAAAPFIAGLLAASPASTVLATSREPLAVQAEERRPVAPLALPKCGALVRADAVVLFCERARAHDPTFLVDEETAAAVAQICRRVDGLPLAIELAAARCGLLSPAEIADRLDEALATPGAGARDADARQQTLRATIDWSHDLLDEPAKACFARFAVFAGGATVDAAEAITGVDLGTIDGLVAKSLLVRRRQARGPTRLHMLETIRAYAADRLVADASVEEMRERHFRHFLALARRHGSEHALMGPGRRDHVAALDADVDNLHRALNWALDQADAGPALELCAAIGQYWWVSGRYADGAEAIGRALRMPGGDDDPRLRVLVLDRMAGVLWPLWRRAELADVLVEAETIARAADDPLALAMALQMRARIQASDGFSDGAASAVAHEALRSAYASGDPWMIAMAAYATAIASSTMEELRTCVGRASVLLEEVGNVYYLARMLAGCSHTALGFGSLRDARDYAARAAALPGAPDDPQSRAMLLGNTGIIVLISGDIDGADALLREHLDVVRELAAPRFACDALRGLAAVAASRADDDRSARLSGALGVHNQRAPPTEIDLRIDAEFLQPARARLGAGAWDAASREGAALSLDAALAYALEDPLVQGR